jgi:diphthamide synthase subunit DPH2
MISQKYKESNILIGQRKDSPQLVQEQIIVSTKDIQRAKDCILMIKEELQKNVKNNVWIPYNSILSQSLPSEKGTDVRIANTLKIDISYGYAGIIVIDI